MPDVGGGGATASERSDMIGVGREKRGYIAGGPGAVRRGANTLSTQSLVRKTLKNILAEYGAVAVVVYLTIFFVVLGGFWLAIKTGWRPASAVGNAGAFTAAYIATKLTQPLRIGATLVLTPFVAKLYERVSGRAVRRGPDAGAKPELELDPEHRAP